jgi:hypothetical protein
MVNYWAVLVAALVSMILGMIWYNPKVFGKHWTKLSGVKPKKEMDKKMMLIAFIGNIVMAGILSMFVIAGDLMIGLKVGFYLWLGFIGTTTLGSVLWQGKPWGLWFLNNAYNLLNILVMAVIFVYWA